MALSDTHTGPHKIQLDQWISCAPFEQLLGLTIEEAHNGESHLYMDFVRKLAQGGGLAHGGALVTLADTAVAMAVKSILPENSRFGTISLASEFLAPVTRGRVTARARTRILENRKIEGRADLFDHEGKKVMTFSSVFKVARDVEMPAME